MIIRAVDMLKTAKSFEMIGPKEKSSGEISLTFGNNL